LKNLDTDERIAGSIRSEEVVLWKHMDHWIMEKETVYEDCDHVATWMRNYVESSTIRGRVKESERLFMLPVSLKSWEWTQHHNNCLT
jgi:hypothetical protein